MTGRQTHAAPSRVVVIGAGAVGLSAALYLQRDGHQVTVIDPRGPGGGSSFGNAGIVSVGSVAPIGLPGVVAKVPKMLLDPMGPLILRWRYLPTIAPWLLRFVMASRPGRVEEISKALAELVSRAGASHRDLAQLAGASEVLRPVGMLKVYSTQAGFDASATERALLTRRGMAHEVLGEDELRQLQPGLAPIFKHGLFKPDADFCANPGRLMEAYGARFVADGGRLLQKEVEGFEGARPRTCRLSDGTMVEADRLVIAAGAWSRQLTRKLGFDVGLDTERGYHLMLPQPDPTLRIPTLWSEHSFFLCPMEEGLRMTSGVEFAGLKAPPDETRIRRLLPLARRMLPSLTGEPTSSWLGFRPSMPDSLPVIGPAPGLDDVFLGFGHGHIGLTLGPMTGKVIADLIAGREPGFDLTPYRPR